MFVLFSVAWMCAASAFVGLLHQKYRIGVVLVYNPYQKYKEQSLTTLTPAELILKLYDEAVKQVRLSINFINSKDLASAHKCLVKTEDIILALKRNLDDRYEISAQLDKMYTHIYNSLVEANVKKDVALLEEIYLLICELRDAFNQANRLSKISG